MTGTEPSVTEHARRERIYLDHLTGIRAIAAVAVVLLHVWFTVFQGDGGATLEHPWWTGWAQSGGYGVTVFIVISGYSLMLNPTKHGAAFPHGTRDFLIRRARRILPAYWAVLVLSAVLGLTVLAHPTEFGYSLSLPIRLWDFVGHVLLVHDVVGNPSGINYVLWSMAVEWQIYFLMPLFLVAVRRGGAWPMVVVTVAASSLVVRATMNHTDIRLLNQFHLVGCFAIGVAACWLARNRPSPRPLMLAATGLAALWLVLEVARYQEVAPGLLYHQSLDVALACSVGFFLAAAPQALRSVPVRLLGSKPLVWMGERSYSLYLLHPLVLALTWNLFLDSSSLSTTARFVVLAVVGVGLTQAAAALTYRHIEVRFQA